ncbi:MAG: DUF3333 domain-containing protein, partial [Woeseiaceae bacterium]
EVTGRSDRRELYRLVSVGAGYQMQDMIEANPELLGTTQSGWVPAASTVELHMSLHECRRTFCKQVDEEDTEKDDAHCRCQHASKLEQLLTPAAPGQPGFDFVASFL